MTKALTVPLAALGALSVKTSSDFDQAMTHSLVRFGDLSEGMRAKFEANARAIALNSTSSATELAEAYGMMADAGMKPKNALTDLAYIQQFATRNSLTLERATAFLTDSMSELGLESNNPQTQLKNMTKLGDQMTRTTEMAGVSIEELSKSLEKHGGSAMRRFNISTEEGLGLLAAFAAQGVKAGQGGQYLADHLGHRKLGQRRGLAEDAEMILTRNAAFAKRVEEQLKSKSTEGLVSRENIAMLKNFNDQMTILWHNIQDAGIEVGRVLTPALDWLNKKLIEVLKWWRGLSETTKTWVVWIGFALGVIGPFLTGLGLIFGLVTWINWTFMFWIGLITLTSFALLGLIDVFLQMTAGINIGFVDMIGAFRVGGYQISTWLASGFFEAALAWEMASTWIEGGLMQLEKAFADGAGIIYRMMLQVIKSIVGNWLMGLTKLAGALDSWIATLNTLLKPFGVSFAAGFAASMKKVTDVAMSYFDSRIDSSLKDATKRHEQFYKDIDEMQKKSAKNKKDYWTSLRGVFADDTQDQKAKENKEKGKPESPFYMGPNEPDDYDPGNKSLGDQKKQEFSVTSLRRFNLSHTGDGLSSGAVKKQQVEAKGVEHRLDKIHEQMRNQGTGATLR